MENLTRRNKEHFLQLLKRYPELETCGDDILQAYHALENVYRDGGKLLIAGNGGSAADSEHIVGELMKSFLIPDCTTSEFQRSLIEVDSDLGRELAENLQHALPAIALDGQPALTTAFINDCNPLMSFAQQVNGLGQSCDAFLGISTSGNSKNVAYAAVVAKARGMKVIGLTGARESTLSKIADVCVRAPHVETFMVQELHLPIYHCWCMMLEEAFFGADES